MVFNLFHKFENALLVLTTPQCVRNITSQSVQSSIEVSIDNQSDRTITAGVFKDGVIGRESNRVLDS